MKKSKVSLKQLSGTISTELPSQVEVKVAVSQWTRGLPSSSQRIQLLLAWTFSTAILSVFCVMCLARDLASAAPSPSATSHLLVDEPINTPGNPVQIYANFDLRTTALSTSNFSGNDIATGTVTIYSPPISLFINGPSIGYINTFHRFIASVLPVTTTQPITYCWQASEQSPIVHRGDLSATADFSWTTTGTKTITVIATNFNGSVSDTLLISVVPYKIYLPFVLQHWPPNPDPPKLYSIDNADGDGSYQISWSTADLAELYVLEETTYSSFTDLTEVYKTVYTSFAVSEKDPGRYYYRVKACNEWACSLSNVEWVDVWWENEPNDSLSQANGPLISDVNYYGYPNDVWDCFKIDVHSEGKITVYLTNHVGKGVQVQLRDQNAILVAYDWIPPYHIEHTVPAGQYYICIFTESGYTNDVPYNLRVMFP